MTSPSNDIRVVVAIDFGTTYSGFAYVHQSNPKDIIVQDNWKGIEANFKAPTVISYTDDSYTTVKSWGFPALAGKPIGKKKSSASNTSKPIELFKLHLLGKALKGKDKPFLPNGLDYKKVIKDYLEKLGEEIKKSLDRHWQWLDFYNQVLIILTVPAEFNDNAIATMRECVFNAHLIREKDSENLKITTEPEAAAIHSMNSLKNEHNLSPGVSFMVVDCGGGTVDLTIRELLDDDKLSEITERTGDYCGSCYVDQKFVEFLGKKIGESVVKLLKENHYACLQYIVQDFCKRVKMPFTGQQRDFQPYEIDLDDYRLIKQYLKRVEIDLDDYKLLEHANRKERDELEEDEWLIVINFDDVKKMFDPVIERILTLIRKQLEQCKKKCSIMLLVGGFSESEYLQARIRQEFSKDVPNISVPTRPITSIMKGAAEYGLSDKIVKDRILKWTYGTDIVRKWRPSDPLPQKLPNGFVIAFETLAKRGKQVSVNDKVTRQYKPYSLTQRKMDFDMYFTSSYDPKYCNKESEVKLLRKWEIKLPKLDNFEEDVNILFTLTFGDVEMKATAENKKTREKYHVSFKYDSD